MIKLMPIMYLSKQIQTRTRTLRIWMNPFGQWYVRDITYGDNGGGYKVTTQHIEQLIKKPLSAFKTYKPYYEINGQLIAMGQAFINHNKRRKI